MTAWKYLTISTNLVRKTISTNLVRKTLKKVNPKHQQNGKTTYQVL